MGQLDLGDVLQGQVYAYSYLDLIFWTAWLGFKLLFK